MNSNRTWKNPRWYLMVAFTILILPYIIIKWNSRAPTWYKAMLDWSMEKVD